MKTAGLVGISLAGISAVIAVVANAQMSGGPSRNVQKTDRVADAVGETEKWRTKNLFTEHLRNLDELFGGAFI